MSNLYAWVPWFTELARKIADRGEGFLSESVAKVDWNTKNPPPLVTAGGENIDPFSFFYYLAARSRTAASREIIYPSVDEVFGTSFSGGLSDDDAFVFPVPPAITGLFRDGDSFHPTLLWSLFRQAVVGSGSVQPGAFEEIRTFKGVGIPKLTQALFLVNPEDFLPCDDKSAFELCGNRDAVDDWTSYGVQSRVVRSMFPGLRTYEINRASFLLLPIVSKLADSCAWQSSKYQEENSGKDYWSEFRENGCIHHGRDSSAYLLRPTRGDLVLVRKGSTEGLGIGVVYRNGYKGDWAPEQRLHLLWLNAQPASMWHGKATAFPFSGADKTLGAFRDTMAYRPTFALLEGLGWKDDGSGPGPKPRPVQIDDDELPPGPDLRALAEATLIDESKLQDIRELLEDKKQMIFQGPPGTGKTYLARRLAACLAGNADHVRLVQFHPSYSYEDFVQGYRPTLKDGQAGFRLRNGPLLRMARRAEKKRDTKHFLVIDEINRGNLSKILGELYFLLEYRDEAMRLQYSDKSFSLPPNLYIIGTMNTADRSIALVDLALRRRFHFVEFHPDKPLIEGLLGRWLDRHAPKMHWVEQVVAKANQKLDDRHAAIGPSYFMPRDKQLDEERVRRIWKHSVLPYVEEHLFGHPDLLAEFDLGKLRGKNGGKSTDERTPDSSEPTDANA